jgi:hypothetical protein
MNLEDRPYGSGPQAQYPAGPGSSWLLGDLQADLSAQSSHDREAECMLASSIQWDTFVTHNPDAPHDSFTQPCSQLNSTVFHKISVDEGTVSIDNGELRNAASVFITSYSLSNPSTERFVRHLGVLGAKGTIAFNLARLLGRSSDPSALLYSIPWHCTDRITQVWQLCSEIFKFQPSDGPPLSTTRVCHSCHGNDEDMILAGSISLPGRGSLLASEVSVRVPSGEVAGPFYFLGKPELVSLIVSADGGPGSGMCPSELLERGSPMVMPRSTHPGTEYYGHGLIVQDSQQQDVFVRLGLPRLGEEYVRPMRIPHFKPSELSDVQQPGRVMF